MSGQRSSAGRLRSKTSDISDLLRGSRSETKQPDALLIPPVPPISDSESPTKPKHKLSFFGRRRKSSSVSPSSAKSAETRAQAEEGPPPPLPKLDMGRLSTSTQAAGRSASTPSSPSSPTAQTSLPSSLPPLDVSPPSLSPLSQLTPPKDLPRLSHAPHSHAPDPQPSKNLSAIPTFRHLRPQKSTSFEFGRRSHDSQGPGAGQGQRQSRPSGERPIITVSAPPPTVEEDAATYTTPRVAPPPPVQRSMPIQGHSRSAARDVKDSPESSRSGPASPTTPQSPLRFPIPPPSTSEGTRLGKERAELSADEMVSIRTSISSSSSTRETLTSFARNGKNRLQKHASAIPLGLPRSKQGKGVSFDVARSAPESNGRAGPSDAHPTLASPSRSRIPASPSFQSNSKKVPPPLLTNLRRSPRAYPPTEPLPNPPLSAPARSGTDEDSQSMAGMPTIPSLASRMSVGDIHQLVFRSRANTSSSHVSTSTGDNEGGSSPVEQSVASFGDRFLQGRDSPGRRTPVKEHVEAGEPRDVATIEQLREALNSQSAKYQRLSSYLVTLSERHTVEKNELMRRIEVLEREARKREREITGLRWLVMNAGQRGAGANGNGNGESPRPAAVARLRSDSKSSQASPRQGSMAGSPADTHRGMSMDSAVDSIEEGLYEMQKSVSDFITPSEPSPATSDAIASPVTRASPGNGRMRRSNTLPYNLAQLPLATKKQKMARRTSSPVIPTACTAGLGLDIDMPSIPSLPATDAGHMTPASSSSGSAMSTLPPLTTASTVASGLSVIPESPCRVRHSSDARRTLDKAQEPTKREGGEKRTSRALNRLSASSTSSSLSASPASSAYGSNLKLGASPSIAQVLDRATEKESDMDVILRKLRAFGHN